MSGRTFSFRADDALARTVEARAKQTGQTESLVIRDAIQAGLEVTPVLVVLHPEEVAALDQRSEEGEDHGTALVRLALRPGERGRRDGRRRLLDLAERAFGGDADAIREYGEIIASEKE